MMAEILKANVFADELPPNLAAGPEGKKVEVL